MNRRVAVVDIGTNTLKFSVTAVDDHGHQTIVDSHADTVRLGYRLGETGRIAEDRSQRALEALSAYEKRAAMFGTEAFLGIATAAMRSATNGPDVLNRISSDTRWSINVISGDDEAQLAFEGLRDVLPAEGASTIVDIGGGSTEIIATRSRERVSASSVQLGSGVLADRCFAAHPPGKPAVIAARDIAASTLAESALPILEPGGLLVLSGGNGQFLQGIAAWPGIDVPFTPEGLPHIMLALAEVAPAQVAAVLGIAEERARMLPAGAAIAVALVDIAQPAAIAAAPSGLRGAVVARWFRTVSGSQAQR